MTERKLAQTGLADQRSFRVRSSTSTRILSSPKTRRDASLGDSGHADAYGTSSRSSGRRADFNPNKERFESFRRDDLEVMNTLKRSYSRGDDTDARASPLAANHKRPIITPTARPTRCSASRLIFRRANGRRMRCARARRGSSNRGDIARFLDNRALG